MVNDSSLLLTRVRVKPWVCDPVLAFDPGARGFARPPETVQSRPGHGCCGTVSVAVARRDPTQLRTRSARETRRGDYATCIIAPVGTTPVVAYRQSAITNLRATATIPMRRARFPPRANRW